MSTRPRNHARLALLAVAALVAIALVAIPTTAFAAKATTRIVPAKKTQTISRNTPGTNPWPVSLSAKLQKKVSGTYRALSATVKLYRWDPQVGDSGAYVYLGSKKGSSVTFSLPGRGKYKLTYAGSTKTKSSLAYSDVYETIGATVSTPTITLGSVDGTTTQSWVNVKYNVNWNTQAHDGPVILSYRAYFEDADSIAVWVDFEREFNAPGMVEFNYKVNNSELLDDLNTWGYVYVDEYFGGNHIVTPADLEYMWNTPG